MLALVLAAALSAPTDLRFRNIAARVVVIPARGGQLSATVQPAGPGPAPHVRREGTTLVVDGGVAGAGKTGLFDWFNQSRCRTDPKALPLVTVRAPANVRISGDGVLFGQSGPSDSFLLDVEGCGHWAVAPVVGPLWMQVKGATTVDVAGHAPKASLYAWGASKIHDTGEVGALTAEVHGSSTIRVRLVDGQVDSIVDGTGDVLYSRPSTGTFCTLC